MDETKLREKLSLIEALFAGATTEGERMAAAEARRRIQQRLESAERIEPPEEFRFKRGEPETRGEPEPAENRNQVNQFQHGQPTAANLVPVPRRQQPQRENRNQVNHFAIRLTGRTNRENPRENRNQVNHLTGRTGTRLTISPPQKHWQVAS